MRLAPWVLFSIAWGCAVEPAAPTSRPPLLPAAPTAGSLASQSPEPMPAAAARLPAWERPLRYALELSVDPRKPTFSGSVKVLVDLAQPSSHVVMHARGPKVTRAAIRNGDETLAATVTERASPGAREADEVVLSVSHPMPKGHVTVELAFEASFGPTLNGLYSVRDGDGAYAFTQFETVDARRAFPCFDEPALKAPFDVSVSVPQGMIVVSNEIETSHVSDAGTTNFRFATTPPLPTYLVALAVGDLDVASGPTSPTPVRLVTTKGKAQSGAASMEVAAKMLSILEGYFGIRYPFSKLDLVAVPDFGAGAMENAGLVTFREELLLLGDKFSIRAKRARDGVIAHELAHQWFGDLVTMRWWDDAWLNEGFATWMANKAMGLFDPTYDAEAEATLSAEYVMDQDGLASARAIRQPIASSLQAADAFDGITYQKGAAVLRMLESFVGPVEFETGVRDYLRAHAYENATAADLIAALDQAAARASAAAVTQAGAPGRARVADVAPGFLDQAGVPVIEQHGACAEAAGDATIEYEETRAWRPLGSTVDERARWTVPVCTGSPAGHVFRCAPLASNARTTYRGSGKCPVVVDHGARAYARVSLDAASLAVAADKLSLLGVPDRIALLSNAWADVRAGRLPPAALLRALAAADGDDERHVVEQVLAILYGVGDALVEPSSKKAFGAFVRARIAPHAARLANAKPTDEGALLERSLTAALAELGDDEPTKKRAEGVARAWLASRRSVDPDRAQTAIEIWGRTADGPARDALTHIATAPTTAPQDRITAIRGLAATADPALLRATLDWTLTPAVRLQDFRYVYAAALSHRENRPVVVDWVEGHWAALRVKLPGPASRGLVGYPGVLCAQDDLDRAKAFFGPKVDEVEDSAKVYTQAVEAASVCVALRRAASASLAAALPKK